MGKFKVGEIAIIKKAQQKNSMAVGLECEILEIDGLIYRIIIAGYENAYNHTGEFSCCEHNLKKKHDGDEEPSWEAIESITKWHPNKEMVNG